MIWVMSARRTRLLAVVAVALTVGLSAAVGRSSSAATSFSFAFIGDLPYTPDDVASIGDLVTDINNDVDVQFVAHVGDVKPSALKCSDSVMQARFDLFQDFENPFWFTPGDNDWTGCWQAGAAPYAPPYDPQQRLVKLRDLFYPNPNRTTGGTTMAVTPQSARTGFAKYVENVRFRRDCITFGSVHQVGATNGLDPVPNETSAQRKAREAEVFDRIDADVAWIDEIFDSAEVAGSKGVFIMMHGRPTEGQGVGTVAVKERLIARATAPSWGDRPVLLANGSEHVYQVNPEFLGVSNLTQWVTAGGAGATGSWIKVNVDCSKTTVDQMFSHTIIETGTTPPPPPPPPPDPAPIVGPAEVVVGADRGSSIEIP
jgi:hypothetical protein